MPLRLVVLPLPNHEPVDLTFITLASGTGCLTCCSGRANAIRQVTHARLSSSVCFIISDLIRPILVCNDTAVGNNRFNINRDEISSIKSKDGHVNLRRTFTFKISYK